MVRIKPIQTFPQRMTRKSIWILKRISLNLNGLSNLIGAEILQESENGICLLRFRKDTLVAEKGHTILIPRDYVIFENVRIKGNWESHIVNLITEHLVIHSGLNATLLDIGANSGMITRQVLRKTDKIRKVICVEPLDLMQEALFHNVQESFPEISVVICTFALDLKSQVRTAWSERRNLGNTSINNFSNKEKILTTIRTKSVSQFTAEYLTSEKEIILKCDTQGYEPLILSQFSTEVWGKTVFGVIEIQSTSHEFMNEIDYILSNLHAFKKLYWATAPDKLLNISEVREFWLSDKKSERDLFFSRV